MRVTNLTVAALSALIFIWSFRINQLFDQYFVYSAGISLLFIPAGIKLLLLLLGRLPAYIGLLIAGTYLGVGIWPDKALFPIFLFAFIGLTNYAVAAISVMKLLKIDRDLSNLKYWHVVLLSALASVFNGVVHNLIYITQDVILTEDFWSKSFAMTLGDFMGCFVTVGIFHTLALIVKPLRLFSLR